ncbi:MAG: Ni/Fe-hydrogenase cytochrome b subunit [Gemmatimonadetes bacterium]|nr:Ni/Fe-hydrogenase cytochrome b subunit [Gemmatimonadota bacterium]
MDATVGRIPRAGNEARRLGQFILQELKPRGKVLTPFNVISGALIVVAAVLLAIRFLKGLGAITNLSQDFPWGLWIGYDVMTGVAIAGGGYVLTFMVYVLHLERYHPIIRVTVLNAFLGYVFAAGSLLLDLGRPWNIMNPMIGNGFGVSSVLFLVAWHFFLYALMALVEFSPAAAEWLGLERIRRVLKGMTFAAVVLGITLALLHQAGLGGLFLMAKGKLHPLWYTEFIPVLFFVSSVFAGLSLVIVEGFISRKVFAPRLGWTLRRTHEDVTLGLGRVCAGTLFAYFFLMVVTLLHGQKWAYLATPMGAWFLLEIVGFVAVPAVLFAQGYRTRNVKTVQAAALMALAGVLLNRLNVAIIAYKPLAAVHYVPSWMEVEVTLAIIAAEIWVFRWVVNRMPVLDFAEVAPKVELAVRRTGAAAA